MPTTLDSSDDAAVWLYIRDSCSGRPPRLGWWYSCVAVQLFGRAYVPAVAAQGTETPQAARVTEPQRCCCCFCCCCCRYDFLPLTDC